MSRKSEEEEGLEKVYIDLPNHWAIGGESMWAKPLGNNLYEIHNIPMYAYGINYFDIVETVTIDKESKPQVTKLVEKSGSKTLRVVFLEDEEREKQNIILGEFDELEVLYERANDSLVAISIDSDDDYNFIYDRLQELEDEGKLSFETCEQKIEGSFDAVPEEIE